MTTDFLHGVEVIEIDDGARAMRIEGMSIIGLVGTAPAARSAIVAQLITGTAAGNTGLTWAARASGVAGNALAVYLGVPSTANAALAITVTGALINISLATGPTAGVATTTATQLMSAINADAAASALVSVTALSGSTGAGVVAKSVKQLPLSGGVDEALPLNTPRLVTKRSEAAQFGVTGTIPAALDAIWDQSRARVVVVRVTEGADAAATQANVIGSGATMTGAHAFAAAQSVVHQTPRILIAPGFSAAAAVASELVGIAEQLRAIVVADGPNTTDADAITYRNGFGSDRLYLVDPNVNVWSAALNAEAAMPASASVAGVIVRTDQEIGPWASPSNHEIYGITGTARPIDFAQGDSTCRANYLNENEVATIIRINGYRLWGNRTCSADPKWAFINVRRAADLVHEALLQSHLWAVDRNITTTYFEDVRDGVQAFLDGLISRGAISRGARCWVDPELNTPESIAAGQAYFDFEFACFTPAERITFRSHLNNALLANIVADIV